MIRYIFCVRKRADRSDEEFRRYWRNPRFDALIQRVVEDSGARRFSKTLTLRVEANLEMMRTRGTAEPFDAVLEYWWDKAANLMELIDTAEGKRLLEEMRAYQAEFIDPAASRIFFTEAS